MSKIFETLFDGTLGDFDCDPADLKIKPGQNTPHHAKRAFAIPQIHRKTLNAEIDRLFGCRRNLKIAPISPLSH